MGVKIDTKENKEEVIKNFHKFDKFFPEDEKTLVQLDKNRLSIHQLKPYTSWQKFLSLIETVFCAYTNNIKTKLIQRIGLRYINKIEIQSPFGIEAHFNLRPNIAEALPQNLSNFMIGLVFVMEGGLDNARVQLANQGSRPMWHGLC